MPLQLNEQQKEQFREFIKRANELVSSRIYKNGLPAISTHTKINVSEGTIESSGSFPDEEDFRSMLLSLRPIYMQKEPVNFGKICNIVHQIITDSTKQTTVAKIRKAYNNTLNTNAEIAIQNNDQIYKPYEILNTWLNYAYFHADKNAAQEFKALVALAGASTLKFVMQHIVYNMTSCIAALKEFIEQEFEQSL